MMETEVRVDPWRKHKIIQIIATLEIVVATFSIVYNGRTLLVIFDGLYHEDRVWPFITFILFITFGIQLVHIILAMMLFRASRKESSTLVQSVLFVKIWQIVSIIFLFLLVVEFYIGLKTFEYNNYKVLFVAFIVFKVLWRVFTIIYAQSFRKDLQSDYSSSVTNHSSSNFDEQLSLAPVFRLILTSPENCEVDVSDKENETDQKSLTDIANQEQEDGKEVK